MRPLISWQHLFNHGEDKVYAILAMQEAESMLAIAEGYDIHDRDHLIHFLFGKSCIFLKDFRAEIESDRTLPSRQCGKRGLDGPFGRGDLPEWAKRGGERVILEGVQQIEAHNDIDSFRINVWVSGAYLRLAKLLINDNIDQAKIYLNSKGKR